MKKLLSLILAVTIFLNSLSTPFVYAVFAQEASPEATPVATTEPTPLADPTVEPSPQPVEQQVVETIASPTPSPTPTPTIPSYSSPEYDVYKAEKTIQDQQQETLEDEWEANEENDQWIAAHGGSEEYYTSGQWQIDQDAAAAAAAQQAEQNQTQQQLENDPFAPSNDSAPSSNSCSNEPSTLSADPSAALSTDSSTTTESSSTTNVNVSNNNCADIGNNSYSGGTSGTNSVTNTDGSVDMNTGPSSANGQLENNGNVNVTNSESFGTATSSTDESFAADGTAENLSTGEDSANFTQSNDSYNLTVENNNAATVDNEMTVEGVSGSNTITDNDGNVTLTTGDIELIANMLNILNLNVTGDDFLHLIVNIFGQINGTIDLDDIAQILGYADDDALEVLVSNDDTGDDSVNSAAANVEQNTNVENNNTAVVNNDLNVTGVSGGNDVSGNDGGANVITGRIAILANVLNFINTNMSGDKWKFIMINIFGSLNGDIILPGTDQFLGSQGSVTASNNNPGEGSTNNQTASSLDQSTTTNTNNIELNNNVNANGVSGNNSQSGNDDGDYQHTMQTGGTDIASQILNFLNMNLSGNNFVFLVVNVFGKWMGQIVGFADNGNMNAPAGGTFAALAMGGGGTNVSATNSNTGEDSVNNADASLTTTNNVANNNSAVVNNNINVDGISGANQVNNNDGQTSLTTGWVEIDANLLNIINTNITGNNWMVVFLNVFGDFMGNLLFGEQPSPAVAQSYQDSGIGGSPQNNDSDSNNEHSSDNNEESEAVITQATAQPKSPRVLSSELALETEEEAAESYTAQINEPEDNQDEGAVGAQEEDKGFFAEKLALIKSFFDRIIGILKDFVQPVFAYINQINPLS